MSPAHAKLIQANEQARQENLDREDQRRLEKVGTLPLEHQQLRRLSQVQEEIEMEDSVNEENGAVPSRAYMPRPWREMGCGVVDAEGKTVFSQLETGLRMLVVGAVNSYHETVKEENGTEASDVLNSETMPMEKAAPSKQNPLPCGCSMMGTPQINWNGTKMEYIDRFIRFCPLHAAAPVMYEALKSMLYIFDRGLQVSSIGRRTCDDARASIALVEGNQ